MNIPIGRGDIASLFKNCLNEKKLGQSYIIHGPKGMGKKTAMEYILSLVMCENGMSCGECSSCKSLEMNAHPDVVEIKRPEDKASIGVDVVRPVISQVYIKPVLAEYKAVVVHEAHLLTIEAQNAMLKIIEEPPEKVVFFLLCDTVSPILQTVISRSVMVNLKPLSIDELKVISNDRARDFELNYCMGNPGKLKEIISDEEFLSLRNDAVNKFVKIASDDAFCVYEAVQFLDKNKEEKDELFAILLLFARDALYKKLGMDSLVINTDKINEINAFKERASAKALLKIMQIILNTQVQKGKYGNYTIAVTNMLFKCREELDGRSNRNSF